jgi:hypothetical protein
MIRRLSIAFIIVPAVVFAESCGLSDHTVLQLPRFKDTNKRIMRILRLPRCRTVGESVGTSTAAERADSDEIASMMSSPLRACHAQFTRSQGHARSSSCRCYGGPHRST